MIRKYDLPSHESDGKGILTVMEHVPFQVRRIFWVTGAPLDVARGGHAHKKLKQFLVAITGALKVNSVGPGMMKQSKWLPDPTCGLYVPPLHWLEIHFLEPGSSLLVLCDDIYKETDYIHDFTAFKDSVQ